VIGHNIALDRDWRIGDTVTVKGHEFEVLGIIDKTMTGPDTVIFMGIKPGRDILIENNPFLKSLKEQSEKAQSVSERELQRMPKESREQILQARAFKEEDISTGAGVAWKDGADPEEIVAQLKIDFKDDITVLSPQKMAEQIDKASATFNALILGSALIALIVGGFSVINTMMMSISERTREIGIKKALGASSGAITWEYTLEAGVMGFIGGVAGVLVGWGVADWMNKSLAVRGAEIFLIEPLNLVWIVLFAIVIGMIAGLIPALRAARLKIVQALKEIIS
jgi:putative ABC transport system permease protein